MELTPPERLSARHRLADRRGGPDRVEVDADQLGVRQPQPGQPPPQPVERLHDTRGVTVFVTTHYMDEAEHCDRIAIIDQGRIVALGTPEQLKAQVGADRVQLTTDDDVLAIARLRERFDLEASMSEGQVTIAVAGGAEFVPQLFARLGVGIRSVTVTRPTLDDVFMSHTGRTIRDAEAGSGRSTRSAAWRKAMG